MWKKKKTILLFLGEFSLCCLGGFVFGYNDIHIKMIVAPVALISITLWFILIDKLY